ncbi:MAG: DUF5076 domain-containing protein [Hyphomicrobiaceae bacterium]|nr:DUF5076 domain-containing protein [Hyphomicrobiaceae bacterium]
MDDNDPTEPADLVLQELELPDGVHDASSSVEVMRVWVADGALHVIFHSETFSHDVSEWGRMLGDIAHHIADAVELDGQMPRQQALAAMTEAFTRSAAESEASAQRSGRIKGRTAH